MNSFAIWSKNKDQEKRQNLDLHINFWNLKKNKKKINYCLDFGIMIEDIANLDELSLYCPMILNKEDFKDLGKNIYQNEKLLNAIFNEYYSPKDIPNNKYCEIYDNNNIKFLIYNLDFSSNDVSISTRYEGTIIKFAFDSIVKHDKIHKYYFRFRIHLKNDNPLINNYRVNNFLFESAYWITELFDFRINEKRNLSPTLIQEINNSSEIDFNKVHLLIMKSSNDILNLSSYPNNTARILEKGLWSNYIDFDELDIKTIAYHWKLNLINGSAPNNYFSILMKFRSPKINWKTTIIYILIFGSLAILFNLIANWIFKNV